MFSRLWKSVQPSSQRQERRRTVRLRVERLEDRRVLAAGDLDLTFSVDGMVMTDVGEGRWSQAYDVAIQMDGKIVVAGKYTSSKKGDEFAVVRYNADGSLDTSFGTGGIVRTSFGTKHDFAQAVGIQSDGKIVVGGYANVSNKNTFAMARYNTNGTLDSTFDGDGMLTTNVVSLSEGIRDIVIQPDGKIVAAGYAEVSSGVSDMALVRYNTNGSLDSSFGTGGKVVTPGTNHARAVALAPDGKIVAVGHVTSFGEAGIARYNANGSLDTTFSGNGLIERTAILTGSLYFGIAVQPDGAIVVTENDQSAALRFDTNGDQDLSFAGDGVAELAVDGPYDVVLQADGKIVIGGQGTGEDQHMRLFRLNTDGSADATFGIAGVAKAIFPGEYSWAQRLALQPDGKIVAAGGAGPSYANFGVARFEGDPPPAPLAGGSDAALLLFLMEGDGTERRRSS